MIMHCKIFQYNDYATICYNFQDYGQAMVHLRRSFLQLLLACIAANDDIYA